MALWHGQVVLASVMGKWYRQVLWAGDTGKTLLDDTVVRASIWASGMGKWYDHMVWSSVCIGRLIIEQGLTRKA